MKIFSSQNYFSVFTLLFVFSFNVFAQQSQPKPTDSNKAGQGIGTGRGMGEGYGAGIGSGKESNRSTRRKKPKSVAGSLRLLTKPRAIYTEEARKNGIEGVVKLKVTFSANGQITDVWPVAELPFGLTESAIAAAKKIKFEPAKKNGVPVSVIKMVVYEFNLYSKRKGQDLKKPTAITKNPQAVYPGSANAQSSDEEMVTGTVIAFPRVQGRDQKGTCSHDMVVRTKEQGEQSKIDDYIIVRNIFICAQYEKRDAGGFAKEKVPAGKHMPEDLMINKKLIDFTVRRDEKCDRKFEQLAYGHIYNDKGGLTRIKQLDASSEDGLEKVLGERKLPCYVLRADEFKLH